MADEAYAHRLKELKMSAHDETEQLSFADGEWRIKHGTCLHYVLG